MSFLIYYFSATGNSLEISRRIAKELGDCIIKPMTAQVPVEPVGGDSEAVGFVFPVFYNGLPRLVKRFAEKTCHISRDLLLRHCQFRRDQGKPVRYARGYPHRKRYSIILCGRGSDAGKLYRGSPDAITRKRKKAIGSCCC